MAEKKDVKEEFGDLVNMAELTKTHISASRDLMNQLLGQVQMANTVKKFSSVLSLTKITYIKENKLYRELAGQKFIDSEGNEIPNVGTWEGFCKAVGTSRQKVEEDLQNLKAFGEEALDAMKQMGVSYHDLRQYRRLPEDQKETLIELAKSDDKESFIDLAEEIIIRHNREKEELSKTVEDLKTTLTARERVLSDKNTSLDAVKEELLRLKNIPPDQEIIARGEKENQALKELHTNGLKFLGAFNQYLAAATGILNNEELSHHASETVMELTSGMCTRFADMLQEADIDIDFRAYVYPLEFGNIPERGVSVEDME